MVIVSLYSGAISGIHPLSDQTITKIMDFKYGRDTKEPLIQLFQEEYNNFIKLQKENGFPIVSSGQIGLEDLIRPFTRSLDALKSYEALGDLPINRFHYTNTFYRQPTLVSKFPEESNVILVDNNTLTGSSSYGHHHVQNDNSKIIVPGPYSFIKLIDQGNIYGSDQELIEEAGRFLAQELHKLPSHYKQIQFDEPFFVWERVPRNLRESIINAYIEISENISGQTTIVHTYFESAKNILNFLLSLPTSGLGIDLVQTNILDLVHSDFANKILQVGLLDSQNYIPNANMQIDESSNNFYLAILKTLEQLNPKKIVVSPTATLEYLPRQISDQVITQIANLVKEVN